MAENLEWERYSEVLGGRRMSGGAKNGCEEMGGGLRRRVHEGEEGQSE